MTTLDGAILSITDTAVDFSLLKIQSPYPVVSVDKTGAVFVYTKEGEKLDTGVVMPTPLGEDALYEVMRALGLRCAAP